MGVVMRFIQKAKDLYEKVLRLKKDVLLKEEAKLPSETYFLSADEILCEDRYFGDSRYPYQCDGLTLWTYASGNMKAEESLFNVFLFSGEGKEPNLGFFVGIKDESGYVPVSLLKTARQPIEKGVYRFTVFTAEAAYYFTQTKDFVACVRMTVDSEKAIRFSVCVLNGEKEMQTYVSSYFNPFLKNEAAETNESKWYRSCSVCDYGFLFKTVEYLGGNNSVDTYAALIRSCADKTVVSTTSRCAYCGGSSNQLYAAKSLFEGEIVGRKEYTEFTETAIAADLIPLTLKAKENYEIHYSLKYGNDENVVCELLTKAEGAFIDSSIYVDSEDKFGAKIPQTEILAFDNEKLNGNKFNYFIKNVFRQVEFCSRAKNYAGAYIGVRDIFQQLEAALAWIPAYCRKKMIEALGYIGDDGRPPRQYTYPVNPSVVPEMDVRPYIDQGLWIISTFYKYLSFTNDYSILDEICGYYKISGKYFKGTVEFSEERDSALEHLLRISDYLISKIDKDTHCLRALYGDWNDALDGLGCTQEKGVDLGSGVSVMATLQLYANLGEMIAILKKVGKFEEKIKTYEQVKLELQQGILHNCIQENAVGKRKILHGWGDKRSFYVGSFCDNDGYDRDSATVNAFFVLSGVLNLDMSLKKDILEAYDRLDSKYGIKTFEPYFPPENTKVGRITKLPKGTAENGATYIHATLFAIWSLFEMGEAKRAWEQIEKILPITHEFVSTSPFVMSNSYLYNEEKKIDGESMADWFTGSGCVLLKVILQCVFGIQPSLDAITIRPADYMPYKSSKICLTVKNVEMTIIYENKGLKERAFYVDDKFVDFIVDEKTGYKKIMLDGEILSRKSVTVSIFD